jgi:hypothetical protein
MEKGLFGKKRAKSSRTIFDALLMGFTTVLQAL